MKVPLRFGAFISCVAATGALTPAGLVAQPISAKYSPPSQSTPLGTTFVDFDALAPKVTPAGLSRAVWDAPTATLDKFEVHVTTLRPGMASHPPHHHPWEEMLLIRDGEFDVSINGHKTRASAGALVFFASHDVHNLTNVGDKAGTYYVINFCTDLVQSAPDEPAATRAVAGKLPSSVIDCANIPPVPSKTGSRRSVVDTPTLTFLRLESHITTLNPGQSTAVDMRDNGDEFFIVTAGAIEARVNGVTCRMKAESCFYIAPNEGRTFRNAGSSPASYHVFKIVSAKSPQ
jgi:mannose-6-phosphate isomerase-like protein (cupin superfamily)